MVLVHRSVECFWTPCTRTETVEASGMDPSLQNRRYFAAKHPQKRKRGCRVVLVGSERRTL